MKSIPELTALANKFLTMLAEKPYGPYKAAQLIFGTAAANSLATDSFTGTAQFLAPPLPQTASHKRRQQRDDDTDIEDYALGDVQPVSQKRMRQQ